MDREAESQTQALREFARNVARLNAHGDRLKNGDEVLWDGAYAPAQQWEIIQSARLLTGTGPNNTSAFHTPTRRVEPHASCVRTYPDNTPSGA